MNSCSFRIGRIDGRRLRGGGWRRDIRLQSRRLCFHAKIVLRNNRKSCFWVKGRVSAKAKEVDKLSFTYIWKGNILKSDAYGKRNTWLFTILNRYQLTFFLNGPKAESKKYSLNKEIKIF